MNEKLIAINRAVPMLKRAAELHEQFMMEAKTAADKVGTISSIAKECGQALEAAAISLKASGVGVSFEDALRAHAPNIPPKIADGYRRYSKNKLRDIWTLTLPGIEPDQIEDEKPHKAQWEVDWSRWHTFIKAAAPDTWHDELRVQIARDMEGVVEKMGGHIVWEDSQK